MPNMGNGTECSFQLAGMMARKALTLQGAGVQIPCFGMSVSGFLSHGPCPCVSATSHSINALFFAVDFGNDRAQERKTAPVPAPAASQGSVLKCSNATI
jgi:hypothetical protein